MSYNLGRSPEVVIDGEFLGSACCVWRDQSATYVLSAAHVLEGRAEGTPVTCVGLSGAVAFGQTVKAQLHWAPGPYGPLDAGLIQISEMGCFGSSSEYPWASAVAIPVTPQAARAVIICGVSGLVSARFDAPLPAPQWVEGRRYGRLLQFVCDDGETQKGDSGAPVISTTDGTLIGMHVAKHRPGTGVYAWAVPAEDILTTFSHHVPGIRLRP